MKNNKLEKIDVPKGINPKEFFLDFVPKSFNERAEKIDMSEYNGVNYHAQFEIAGSNGGQFGLKMTNGRAIETFAGEQPSPHVVFSFSSDQFSDIVNGENPWFSLDAIFDPQAMKDEFSPEEAQEEVDMLGGIAGQADIEVTDESGKVSGLKINFQGQNQPVVVFRTTHDIVNEIQEDDQTVMEAYMAGKIKIDGPIDFAMHVMALAPEDD